MCPNKDMQKIKRSYKKIAKAKAAYLTDASIELLNKLKIVCQAEVQLQQV